MNFQRNPNLNPSFFCKCGPRLGRKHNSRDRHTPTWTLKIACSARSYALLKASWYRFSDFDLPSRQGLIAKNNRKLRIILYIFARNFAYLLCGPDAARRHSEAHSIRRIGFLLNKIVHRFARMCLLLERGVHLDK